MGNSLRYWIRICFISLLIVSLLGIILRYKIAYSLPFIDQRNLHHGHSHFAFTGWVTQILMVLMVHCLYPRDKGPHFRFYIGLLYTNLVAAYGMLVCFTLWGYGIMSIGFSTLSILVSYVFAFVFIRDLVRQGLNKISHWWFISALAFSVLSSLGTYAEAWLMANRIIHQNWYLGAEYFYLHFQYNGWFFFAAMGLLVTRIESIPGTGRLLRIIFWLFLLALLPAYFLSALWMPIPLFIYILVVAAAFIQCIGWGLMIRLFLKNAASTGALFSAKSRWLLLLSGAALSIKLLLQLGSTYPPLSQLAFGFRPIVIGYLHLVLLGVITIFIVGYVVGSKYIATGKYLSAGAWTFVAGIVINELLLMLQGVMGIQYIAVPHIDQYLLIAACIMFLGILLLNTQIRKPLHEH